jgi:hypothetical protein
MLQYWRGDYDAAMRLARYLAALEPEYRNDVRFTFVRRWDSPEANAETLRLVAEKFAVIEQIASGKGRIGWPEGCNLVALTAINWAERHLLCPVMLIEPDSVPVQRDWINQLLKEWKTARQHNCWLMGAWNGEGGPPDGHINGNCMIRPDFASLVDLTIPQGLAWDLAIAPKVSRKWWITGLVLNRFREEHATDAQIETPTSGTERPVLVHGVKSDDVWEYAKRKGLM